MRWANVFPLVLALSAQTIAATSQVDLVVSVRDCDGPIPGADVMLRLPSTAFRSAQTDGNGRAEFRDLAAGPCSIAVSEPGYFTQDFALDCSKEPEKAIDVLLVPLATPNDFLALSDESFDLVIHAVDREGPQRGVLMTLRQEGRVLRTQRTDVSGRAPFCGIPAKPCRVTAEGAGYATQDVPVDCSVPRWPDQPVEVTLARRGADAGAAVPGKTDAETATVVVRVHDATGPVIGATVALRYENSRVPSRTLVSDENGRVTFKGVLPKACRVTATMPGYVSAEREIARPAPQTEVDLQLVESRPSGLVHPVMPLPAPRPDTTEPSKRDGYPANGTK